MQTPAWDRSTRILHWGLAVTITFQLFSGLYVSDPHTRLFFDMHEIGGLAAACFVLLHWLWSYAKEDLGVLFPWNAEGLGRARDDLAGVLRGRLPRSGRTAGLSGLVHGLGLLAATGMAATGVFIFFIVPEGLGASAASADYGMLTTLSVFHRYLADFLWTYLAGHVAFAILHQLRGNSVFGAVFLGHVNAE